MDQLLELKTGYDKIGHLLELPPADKDNDSLLDQFFYLVIGGEVLTDAEASAKLYGSGKNGSYAPYQKLKSKLKVYLPYRLCQLVPQGPGEGRISIFSARMHLLSARTCMASNKIMAAEWLLLEAFRLGKTVEQFRVVKEAAGELCELYAGPLYNLSEFFKYRQEFQQNAELEKAVGTLQLHYYNLRGVEIKKDRRLQTLDTNFQPIIDETMALLKKHNGSKVVNYGYGLLQSIFILKGDFATAREYAEEALEKAKELTYLKRGILAIKLSSLILILSKLGKYEECLSLINRREDLGLAQSSSPYVYLFYRILSLLALGRYEESVAESGRIDLEEVEKLHSAEYAASFRVIFAYQHVLGRLGYLDQIDPPKQVKKFRFNRFMNQVQLLEKNKQGYNIHLRIIELIYLAVNKKYDTFIDKTEGVEKYVVRYLSKPDHQRNGLFLKMLASATKHNFDPEVIAQEEQESFDTLKSLDNVAFLMDLPSTEFIPYDQLWPIFLAALKE